MNYVIEFHEYSQTFRVYCDGKIIKAYKDYKDALKSIPKRYTGQ
jgi:hypothetical protein